MGPTTGMILIRHGQTEFNRVHSETGRDPGIRDPQLTAVGRSQAAAVAKALGAINPSRLIASPYTRALETADETAEIIAADLRLPISVEPLIAERFAFICDIGSPLAMFRARWPDIAFDNLPDPWWPLREESVEALSRRSEIFCSRVAREAWSRIAVVTHWGFIRAGTGLKVPNGAALRIDPTRPDRRAEPLFLPGTR
jgi:broad specificity phosphatase PhoE